MGDMDAIFNKGGLLGRWLSHYEFRPQQLEMARAIEDALCRNDFLIVEAFRNRSISRTYLF